eukprot:1580028-Rhodomonas_salina.1
MRLAVTKGKAGGYKSGYTRPRARDNCRLFKRRRCDCEWFRETPRLSSRNAECGFTECRVRFHGMQAVGSRNT